LTTTSPQATLSRRRQITTDDDASHEGSFAVHRASACAYWLATELPRVSHLIDLVRSDDF
jgi:hypothetical protein